MQETSKYEIYQYWENEGFTKKEDLIINEEEFKLIINGENYATYYCTPSLLEELIIGNLAINNTINQASELIFQNIKPGLIEVILNKPQLKENLIDLPEVKIKAQQVLNLMNQHLESSPLHKSTGGTHVMSLADSEGIIFSCQDIGRHNALDKLYGYSLKNNINTSDKILFSSGRITNEICEKAVKIGIKVIVSRATVSNLAIDLAIKNDITLIGFTRINRFNLYSHPYRILE